MYTYQEHFIALNGFYFFLIFAAAMSLVVCVAVKGEPKAPQSHQQAPKTENKPETLWSEEEFRKVYSDYRRYRVVFRLAVYTLKVLRERGPNVIERRKKLVVRGKTAYARMKVLASAYNEMSRVALRLGEFPGDLPKCLDV